MRFNIIGNLSNKAGVSQDIQILNGVLAATFGEDIKVKYVPHYLPQCPEAEVNFFVESINPSLFAYAARNIWIPNPEWTCKTWAPYLEMVDEVWCKTHHAVKLFGEKARYIGWTSIDKVMPERKNYHKSIIPVGKNIFRDPRPIVQAYLKAGANLASLPEVHIVHDPTVVKLPPIPEPLKHKIILHSEIMSEKEYDELLHECGIVLCTSAAEGFGHAVNEALSAGCIPILSSIDPFLELTKQAVWVSCENIHQHPDCYGNVELVNPDDILDALDTLRALNFHQRRSITEKVREEYETRHKEFVDRVKAELERFRDLPEYSLEKRLPQEEVLPPVSVITITRNRRPFIPLAKYCMVAQTYPENKIEWVIVDDGDDQIKDLVSDLPNVKYVLLDQPETIGKKRNLGIEAASHDVIMFMDDDDVYPNNSVVSRVAHLMAEPRKECLFSTIIPCYNIHEKKSFMNVPPSRLPMSQRVSEATLCFTRAFWEERPFPDVQVAEADAFIRGREHMCREMSPQDVIVSLVHKKNTSSRKAPNMESNGCHYGFSDDLFTLVTEIGESI